jgi:hypothetical protein
MAADGSRGLPDLSIGHLISNCDGDHGSTFPKAQSQFCSRNKNLERYHPRKGHVHSIIVDHQLDDLHGNRARIHRFEARSSGLATQGPNFLKTQ